MTPIRMFDHGAQYKRLRQEILAAIETVFDSGQLIMGSQGRQFEAAFARFLGEPGGCVAVNSGTDALVVALKALGIGPGDEVITVANTAVPTVSAIRIVGAVPVFCDIDPHTCLMDLARLPGLFSHRTRAVVIVHLFGNVLDVAMVQYLIGNRSIQIIEDCAHAHGARSNGKMVGTLGHIGAFSFYPTKILGAYGDAGICFSRDMELCRRMRSIRMYGFTDRYVAEEEGLNSRMDEIQAAILNVKIKYLPEFLQSRRTLAKRYVERLQGIVETVQADRGAEHSYHLFVVRLNYRDKVKDTLAKCGIETAIHYPYPIHLMKAYAFLGYAKGDLPNTEAMAEKILSLPLYPELTLDAVDRVCAELIHALR